VRSPAEMRRVRDSYWAARRRGFDNSGAGGQWSPTVQGSNRTVMVRTTVDGERLEEVRFTSDREM
jgi:hypothetical protein